MQLLVEMMRYLNAKNIIKFDEFSTSGNGYIAHTPDKPDIVVGIFPTGGLQSDSKLGYDTPTVQFIVRGTKDARTGFNLAQKIYDNLHGYRAKGFTENGIYVVSCLGIQSAPVYIGRDQAERHEYSLNFVLEIKNNIRSEINI